MTNAYQVSIALFTTDFFITFFLLFVPPGTVSFAADGSEAVEEKLSSDAPLPDATVVAPAG